MNTILVIDDSPEVLAMVENTLTRQGYQVITASDGESGIQAARERQPQLIILDVRLPGMDGFQVCRTLRAERHTAHIPVLFLTGRSAIEDMETGFEVGGADYLPKPFFFRELLARVDSLIRRSREHIEAHPRTMLPGRLAFDQNLTDRIQSGRAFAVGYVDIDNFKAFNDTYGFSRGDDAIALTAVILDQALRKEGNRDDFLGHIGGDDFLLITSPERIEAVCQFVIREFDQTARTLYDPKDLERGYLLQRDRRGRMTYYPIMTVSIAVIDSTRRTIRHPARVSEIAAEIKHALKEIPKSMFHIDQRGDQEAPVGQQSLLLVQPYPGLREQLDPLAAQAGLDVVCSHNGPETLLIIDRMPPRLIVMTGDTALIDSANLYQLLRSQPSLTAVPILLLVDPADPRLSDYQSQMRGGDLLLTTPLETALAAGLQQLLRP
ncbi:MAG TPA: response regulator [Acidobacteriota bacterium]